MFKEAGHEVIRLPPYHSELNPIELVWAFMKGYVEINKTSTTNGRVKLLCITPKQILTLY